jgi:hypothetical protein
MIETLLFTNFIFLPAHYCKNQNPMIITVRSFIKNDAIKANMNPNDVKRIKL